METRATSVLASSATREAPSKHAKIQTTRKKTSAWETHRSRRDDCPAFYPPPPTALTSLYFMLTPGGPVLGWRGGPGWPFYSANARGWQGKTRTNEQIFRMATLTNKVELDPGWATLRHPATLIDPQSPPSSSDGHGACRASRTSCPGIAGRVFDQDSHRAWWG
jgi:hypothetical protein